MKEIIKSMAVSIGLGIPFFTILCFSNPELVKSFSSWDIILLGVGFSACIDLAIWGLKE